MIILTGLRFNTLNQNSIASMKLSFLILLFISPWFSCQPEEIVDQAMLDTQTKIITKKIGGKKIKIYLPDSYDDKKSSGYKVIYLNDGEWFFSDDWNLQNTLDKLIEEQVIQPIIVVGVDTEKNRNTVLLPYFDNWVSTNWGNYSPEADLYNKYLTDQLIPIIEKTYNVSKGKDNRALAGASFGGLHAFYTGIKDSINWNMIIALSPSLWVNDFKVFDEIRYGASKIWFDIGATTGEWNYYIPAIERLISSGYDYGSNLFYLEDPIGKHIGTDWVRRITYPLILFAGIDSNESIKDWKVEIEIIQSAQSHNTYFQRINPIIELHNGVKYSVATQASYVLLNDEDGSIEKDGRFKFNGQNDLKTRISYKGLVKEFSIQYDWVQSQK